ncbi:MAG: hypothetical protein ACTHON_17085, partial [Humibacter sp.]
EGGAQRLAADWGGPVPSDLDQRVVTGTVAEVTADVRRFADADVDRVILLPPRDEPDLAAYFSRVGDVAAAL